MARAKERGESYPISKEMLLMVRFGFERNSLLTVEIRISSRKSLKLFPALMTTAF
jgi:hypothetical protein